MCIWTGDSGSIFAKILRKRWVYMMGQHIQLFSKRSLDRLMDDEGFERVYMGIYPYVITFKYLGTFLSRYRYIGAFVNYFLKNKTLGKLKFVLLSPDQMFAIYRKRKT